MGKTKKKTATSTSTNSGKYSEYEFNDEEEQNEKKSHDFLKKFNPNNNKLLRNSNSLKFNHDHPLDKYKQLLVKQYFKPQNANSWKDTSYEPIDIDAIKDSAKGRASGFEVTAVCSSSNYETDVHACSNDRDTRDVLCETNSFAVRDTKEGVASGSINLKENPQHNLLSDNEPIGITSDDDDSIESMSSLISKSFRDNTEDLLEEQRLTSGTDGCEFDKSVVVDPDHIVYGDMFFQSSKLIFTRNYIQFEGTSLYAKKGCLKFECAVDDISIESYWSNKLFTAIVNIHLKPKDMKVAINAKESDTVVLKFAVTNRNWFKIEDNIKALDVRYKETWRTTYHIDAAMTEDVSVAKLSEDLCADHDQHFEEVVYPKGDHDAISICKRDIQLLQPERFINDTIIDFYMKYLKNKLISEEMHRFHLFNSFFFRKLADLDNEPSKAHEGNIAFERVRKWTRKVNLFEKDYIFIPVNFRFHWSLVVICHPGEVVKHKDKKEALLKVPCILHMDSIKGSHRGLKNLFQSYLLEEWKERHKEVVDDVSSRFWNLPFLDLELPQQENSFDCGLFLLQYVELFLQNAPANFNPSMISKSDNFLNKDWFSPADASSKRAHIRELLYKISEDNSHLVSTSNERDSSESGGVDESLNGRECRYETCNSADTCLESDSNYTADKEFNYTPVAEKHLLSVQWYGEANALSDPGYDARSLKVGDYHPQRQIVLYNQPRNFMSPIEECEEFDDPTSAASCRAKELETIQLQLPLENYVSSEEVKKPPGTISQCESEPLSELQQSGYHRPELQRLDTEKDKDIHECSSSTNDDCTDCVVEDSEEITEAQDANECQSSVNQTDICASPDQEADSVAVTCPQTEQMPSNVHAAFVVSDSEDELLELPGISVKPGVISHQRDNTIVLPSRRADFIEITDSAEAHSPVSEIKEQRGAKRPRSMRVGEESPLAKRLQTITID